VDSMSFDALCLMLLCVIIAGVVDAAGVKEDPPFDFVGANGEAVCSNSTKRLLGDILVWIKII
jgi:hypothetical protein